MIEKLNAKKVLIVDDSGAVLDDVIAASARARLEGERRAGEAAVGQPDG